MSSTSTGCLTSLHNLRWDFLKTCNLLSPGKAIVLLNEYLVLFLSVSSEAGSQTSLIVKPNSYSGFSVWISLIALAVPAEDRVFRIRELPVFEGSVFLFVTVLRNAILELMKKNTCLLATHFTVSYSCKSLLPFTLAPYSLGEVCVQTLDKLP
jgi:hypothetical protein